MTEVKECAVALAQRIQTTTVTTEEDNGTRQMTINQVAKEGIETTSSQSHKSEDSTKDGRPDDHIGGQRTGATGDQMTTSAARGLAPDDRRPNNSRIYSHRIKPQQTSSMYSQN